MPRGPCSDLTVDSTCSLFLPTRVILNVKYRSSWRLTSVIPQSSCETKASRIAGPNTRARATPNSHPFPSECTSWTPPDQNWRLLQPFQGVPDEDTVASDVHPPGSRTSPARHPRRVVRRRDFSLDWFIPPSTSLACDRRALKQQLWRARPDARDEEGYPALASD